MEMCSFRSVVQDMLSTSGRVYSCFDSFRSQYAVRDQSGGRAMVPSETEVAGIPACEMPEAWKVPEGLCKMGAVVSIVSDPYVS